MTLPSLILGSVISLLIGSLFHIWRGGRGGRLLFYLGLSMSGFFFAQWLGTSRHWALFTVGPLDVGLGGIGSLLFLLIGYWLSLVEIRRPDDRDDTV